MPEVIAADMLFLLVAVAQLDEGSIATIPDAHTTFLTLIRTALPVTRISVS